MRHPERPLTGRRSPRPWRHGGLAHRLPAGRPPVRFPPVFLPPVVPLVVLCLSLLGCSASGEPRAEGPAAPIGGEPRIELTIDGSGTGTIDVVGLSADQLARLERTALDGARWTRLLRVQVASDEPGQAGSGGSAPDDRPAVLGTHTVVGGVLRFTPQFPLEPGTRYDAALDLDLLTILSEDEGRDAAGPPRTIEATVQLPAPARQATTRIVEVYPTATALPENQLRMYIEFSAPMGLMDGLPHVRLLDQRGETVIDPFLPLDVNLWNEDRTRFTLLFDPGRVKQGILPNEQLGRSLVDGRLYTLVVDEAWRDGAGQPLASSFRREFTVGPPQERALDPAGWRLDVPAEGTRDPLTVTFPVPLDYGLLQRALGVAGDAGRRIGGEIRVEAAETRWTFTPREAWRAGDYQLVAAPTLEDVAGNRIGRPFEVAMLSEVGARGANGAALPFRVPTAARAGRRSS